MSNLRPSFNLQHANKVPDQKSRRPREGHGFWCVLLLNQQTEENGQVKFHHRRADCTCSNARRHLLRESGCLAIRDGIDQWTSILGSRFSRAKFLWSLLSFLLVVSSISISFRRVERITRKTTESLRFLGCVTIWNQWKHPKILKCNLSTVDEGFFSMRWLKHFNIFYEFFSR